MQFKVYGWFQF